MADLSNNDDAKAPGPAFFALPPFSTALQSGGVEVTAWDENLSPRTSLLVFAGVDADTLARFFLSNFDRLMAPPLAVEIQRVSPSAFDRLLNSRAAVLAALAQNLDPVLADQPAGDPGAAAGVFKEALSAALSDAYSVAAIVQLPAVDPGPAWQTFAVTSKTPEKRRVVVAASSSGDEVAVPVALRACPLTPALSMDGTPAYPVDDMEDVTSGDPIADAVRALLPWSLAVSIGRHELAAQDDVWVPVAFNRPLDEPAAGAAPAETATPLAAALVRFQAGFVSVEPCLDLIGGGGPKAVELTTILADLVGGMVESLKRAAATAPRSEAPNSDLTWVLRQADLSLNILTVFARAAQGDASQPVPFPNVDGGSTAGAPRAAPASRSPDGRDGWMEVDYAFSAAVPDQLTLTLPGLNVLIEQTAIGEAWITRNLELDGAVNSSFVYRAPRTSASTRSPAIHVTDTLGPFNGASVAHMLTSALTPLAAASETAYRTDFVGITVAYRYPLGNQHPPFVVAVPVLKTDDPLKPDPASLADVCAEAIVRWGQANPLPRDGARLSISLTLDAVLDPPGREPQRIRLLTIDRLDLNLPAGWPDN